MKYFFPLTLGSILLGMLLFTACDTEEDDGLEEVDFAALRQTQLTDLYDNEVLPLHEAFAVKVGELNGSITDFAASPSTSTLEAVRTQWKEVATLWKECEMYNFGEVNRTFIHFRIHRWPTNVRIIEDSLQSTGQVTDGYAESLGSSSKGIAAIEYLIFNGDASTNLTQFTGSQKRMDFLVEISSSLEESTDEYVDAWKAYGPDFSVAVQSGLTGGQNLAVNSLVSWIEVSLKSRINRLIEEGVDEAESPYANASREMLVSGFDAWKRLYSGEYGVNGTYPGLDDYLISLERGDLDTRIQEAITNCDQAFSALAGKTLTEWVNEEVEKVNQLDDALRALLVLVKADMSSAMSVTITPNASDGD
ncbi:MAG: imelysin family protein [Bacteroidota bacterium]